MRRNKLLTLLISLVGASLIIGSGFAFWIFDDDSHETSTQIGVNISLQKAANEGSIEFTHHPSIMMFSEGNNANNLKDGITFYSLESFLVEGTSTSLKHYVIDDDLTFKYTPSSDNPNFDLNKLTIIFSVNIETKSGNSTNIIPLSKYLTCEINGYNEYNEEIGGNKYYILDNTNLVRKTEINNETNETITYYESNFNINEFFRYTSLDVKPNTTSKYQALYSDYQNYKDLWNIHFEVRGIYTY